jgi:hypothetical protein
MVVPVMPEVEMADVARSRSGSCGHRQAGIANLASSTMQHVAESTPCVGASRLKVCCAFCLKQEHVRTLLTALIAPCLLLSLACRWSACLEPRQHCHHSDPALLLCEALSTGDFSGIWGACGRLN